MFMLGIAAGNYATSLVHRLPRGLTIANDPPYCECERRVYLPKRDLFPLFSWLINRGRCRFCDIRIPATYTVIEGVCGALFVANFLIYDIGEMMILILVIEILLITAAAIYFLEQQLTTILLVGIAGAAGMYRVLLDGTVFNFVAGAYLGLMIGIIIWGMESIVRRSKLPFPAYAVMLATGGGIIGREGLLVFFIITFLFALLAVALRGISPRFQESAWMIGVTCSVILGLSHGVIPQ